MSDLTAAIRPSVSTVVNAIMITITVEIYQKNRVTILSQLCESAILEIY